MEGSKLGASGDKSWHGFLACLLNADPLRKLLIALPTTSMKVLGCLLVRKRGNATHKFSRMARITGGVWFVRVVSEIGVTSPEDAHQMTEVGLLLYRRLQSAPSFRYALVGIEVDEFRTYSELVTADGQPDILVAGLVLAEEVWKQMGCPVGFRSFNPGYLWKPYQGEVYSPLRASSQWREKLNELLVVSSSP